MKFILLFSFFFFLLFACINDRKDFSNIPQIKFATENPQACFIDEISKDISCHNLELPENYFFGDITDIIPVNDSLLLFHDYYNKQIHVFTRNGKFINVLNNQGRGPEEYLDIESFAINRFDSQLIIYDHSGRKFVSYTIPELKHIKSQPIDKSLMASIFVAPDKLLIISDDTEKKSLTKTICSGVGIYDLNTKKFEGYDFDNLSSSIYLSYPRTFSFINGTYYYAYPDENSVIYKITPQNDLKPFVKFDFGDKNGNKTFWECNDILKFNEFIINNQFALMPHFFTFTEEACSFFFICGDTQRSCMALSNWKGDENYVYKDINIRGIQMPTLRPVGILNDSYIFLIYPHECEFDEKEIQKSPISQMIAEKLNASSDEGTPVLFTFKPKLP